MKVNAKKICAIILAILFVVNTAATVFLAMKAQTTDNRATANVEVTSTSGGKTSTIPKKDEADRVLLIDESGSMNVDFVLGVDFDTTTRYSDSKITENVLTNLNNGANYIVYVTDLEAYPTNDLSLNVGNHENVYLAFAMTEDVDFSEIAKHKAIWANALNQTNSTLIFVYPDGTEMVVFDNYSEDAENEEEEAVDNQNVSIKVDTEATTGDSISFRVLVVFLGTIIDLFLIFGIIIAILMDRNESGKKDVPAGIQDVLKDTTAFDGSGSFKSVYTQMLEWAEKMNISEVYRFASEVQKMSVSEAKSKDAEGQTHGWECLKKLFDAGERRITIVSDMDFNDDESMANGISFDHINFVLPENNTYNQEVMDKVIKLTKTYKVERV